MKLNFELKIVKNKKVSKLLFGGLLTFLLAGCQKKTLVFVQPSLQENFSHKQKNNSIELAKTDTLENLFSEKSTISVSINETLEASSLKTFQVNFQTRIKEKSILGKVLRKDDPKPRFLGKFREKLKNWHPFKRKHKFTDKLWIGLILLGIAVSLELFVHLQILTIIFGIAALYYLVRGLKRLL